MQLRRPPGEGTVANSVILALALLIVPWLVNAQQQQNQGRQFQSPHEAVTADVLPTVENKRLAQAAQQLETSLIQERRKRTVSVDTKANNNDDYDASAIATLAPADLAVRAPPARRSSIQSAGLSSPQNARSLEDWEVEDFVLLATVDGKLHARDRRTGKERWTLEVTQPMVEIIHHRRNRSIVEDKYHLVDDFVWIVEPSSAGNLFVYVPGGAQPGLVNTGLTMKKLVEEMSPYADEETSVVYTGEKKTTMITLDSTTGRVLKSFGSGGALVNDDQSCYPPPGFGDPYSDECSSSGTLTLGRTEYLVNIHRKEGGQVATLRYSEWGPNNYDQDLHRQHHRSLDFKYVYSRHDGSVFAYDLAHKKEPNRLFQQKFTSPVARVFDVARPLGTENKDPELVVLPQPAPPDDDDGFDTFGISRSSRIFVNHTEEGSWYAMSGSSYPQAIDGPEQAPVDKPDYWEHGAMWGDVTDDKKLRKALVGLHSMKNDRTDRLTLSMPSLEDLENETLVTEQNGIASDQEQNTLVDLIGQLPSAAGQTIRDFVNNPILTVVIIGFLIIYWKELTKRTRSIFKTRILPILESKGLIEEASEPPKIIAPLEIETLPEKVAEIVHAEGQESQVDITDIDGATDLDQATPLPNHAAENAPDSGGDTPQPIPEKKKAHRGRRGGVKHKKTKDRSNSEDSSTQKPPVTVEEAVRNAKTLGLTPSIEPDIQTLPNGVSDVSGPILRLSSLEVDTNNLIGTGSNGTMVFEGKFDGREVAVKRMLMQFYDIASQETKLLRESDDHPNVIRYYAQQQSGGFLYIALELCPASLSDVIEKPHLHRDLAQSGEKDLPNVLYQITNGLSHLHSLRIVHRDLKPQNILVSMAKDGRPRLLVSDFGLCKKLEGEQSSFRATTAHAAGTSGWRAPELLLDDDARDGQTMIDASTHSGNGSITVNDELLPNRRATRAIDIFSLGLVFFYVLTQGRHPFDCGDRYMREVNIRKGNYNLKPLEVLGDYSYEAQDLIESMIDKDPRRRPTARQVMAHPFFWGAKKRLNFLCDVSDHFEKEKRDPPSPPLLKLEEWAPEVCRGDFLKPLGKEFVESMGKQRKYTGTRLLDLLRALRNKKNHYEDMSEKLKKDVGPLPEGYLSFWTRKFPNLLICCWNIVYDIRWDGEDRFVEYYTPQVAAANL